MMGAAATKRRARRPPDEARPTASMPAVEDAHAIERRRRTLERARQDSRLSGLDVLLLEKIAELAAVQTKRLEVTPEFVAGLLGIPERGATLILRRLVRCRYLGETVPPGAPDA